MDFYQVIKGTAFLLSSSIEILGNSILLVFFSCIAYEERLLMTSEVILLNLIMSNFVMALTRGLPNSLFIYGPPNIFSDIQCQLLVYVSRVSRAMSICLTCLLSCYQCVTLMSTTPTCMSMRVRLQTYIGHIIILLLVVNMTMCITPLLYAVSGNNITISEYAYRASYCIVVLPSNTSLLSQTLTLFARDLMFVAVMSIASFSILYTLYKHGKRVKGMRRNAQSQTLPAEARASKTVSTLVTLYIFFFGIDSCIWFYQSTSSSTILTSTSDIRYFVSVCYSSVFPFVILFYNQKVKHAIEHHTGEHQSSTGIKLCPNRIRRVMEQGKT
ncbi:olfactory receptor class A-like protein 1 [Pleurodeles waltl]|uniref:olfactory receptor class A-like protein 1 n=1 Tax=Pleurodeles waltl TaxID=8319 RepID=UPI00370973DB